MATAGPAQANADTEATLLVLLRLIAGQVCLHASMAGMRLAAPLWALQQGSGAMAVGGLLALFSLSQVFLALPAGRLADRHGLRRPVALGIICACLGAGLAALRPHYVTLCIAALLMGAGTGIGNIALQRHVGRSAQSAAALRRVFSWLSLGPALSNFLGPVAAGLLIDHAGFRAAFVLMALMPLLAWLGVRRATEKPEPVSHAKGSRSIWPLLRNPLMRRLLFVNWLLSSCWDVHTLVVPVLGHERGFSASVMGAILGSFAVSAVVVRVLLPLLAAHLREWVVISCAMVGTALLFAVYPFMPGPWSMGVCSVLLGLVLGSVQPMVMSTLHQITPHAQQGQAIALRLMAINLSSVLMPLLFGSASGLVGVSVVFWVVGGLVGSGAHAAWRLRPQSSMP
jgi:MFS family permease